MLEVTQPPWMGIARLPTHLAGSLLLKGGCQVFVPHRPHLESVRLLWTIAPAELLAPCSPEKLTQFGVTSMGMDGFSPGVLTGFCTSSVTLLAVLSKYPQADRNQGSETSWFFVLTPHN